MASPSTPETGESAKPAPEVSFYVYMTVLCPDCHSALTRIKLKSRGYMLVHERVAGCPFSGKKFAMPMQALKEITE